MSARNRNPRLDPLHPACVAVFLILLGLWLVAWATLWTEALPRWLTRVAGYLALLGMLVPYVHVLRRMWRYRSAGAMARWLRWHIAAAYAAFALLLLHCRGQAGGWLTLTILSLFWAVMLSGVVGFYGQKLLYRLMPFAVPRELGLERLEPRRRQLLANADDLLKKDAALRSADVADWQGLRQQLRDAKTALHALIGAQVPPAVLDAVVKDAKDVKAQAELMTELNKILKRGTLTPDHASARQLSGSRFARRYLKRWPEGRATEREVILRNRLLLEALAGGHVRRGSTAVEDFCENVLDQALRPPLALWPWPFAGVRRAAVSANAFLQAKGIGGPEMLEKLTALEALVGERDQVDLEYWLHGVGRLWLLIHGPTSAALLLLVLDHVWMSIRFGGW